MALDFSRCRLPPFQHQREDIAWLIDRPYAFIASEMRTGKSKIVIDAAQFLYEAGKIDTMIVVAPAAVRDVWYDKTLGELAKHLWLNLNAQITEFHAVPKTWAWTNHVDTRPPLRWFITNYEFLRSEALLRILLEYCGSRTMVVFDESAFLRNHKSQQTVACMRLRYSCGRVVLLNGTPIFHSPMDLFSQGNLLHPKVLDCRYVTHYKAKYTLQAPILGQGGKPITDPRGHAVQKVVDWVNLDDLQRRFAHCTVRRLQKDCIDAPVKLDPVALTARLTPRTWKSYCDMRDELVVWLQSGEVATAATAATKVMRLAQITSGFLGGIEDSGVLEEGEVPEGLLQSLKLDDVMIPGVTHDIDGEEWPQPEQPAASEGPIRAQSREKLEVLLWFLAKRWSEDPNAKIVSWCRFRAELSRTVAAVADAHPNVLTASVVGGQRRFERLRALGMLKPETAPAGPAFVCGIFGTGSYGLDMCASHTCITISHDYSPGRTAQSADRVYGPAQKFPIAYYDIIATGPKGQKTIDHAIVEARRKGEDTATWTAAAWVKALKEE